MIDPQALNENVMRLLEGAHAEFKIFTHREALTWEDLAAVQKETGFFGTEMKCMVLTADHSFIVFITMQGKKVNFDAIKEHTGSKKVKCASSEDLLEYFGAKPGCAYPFGFDERYPIYVDPALFDQEWLLFSPVVPTKTIQVRGKDLRRIFQLLRNDVEETSKFNQT